MACTYTGTIIAEEFLVKDTGEFVVQFFTENIDTSEQIPLTVPFLFDTDKTQAEIQADIDAATIPGNVITLVAIDGDGSDFSLTITRGCPSENLQSLLLAGEAGSATASLTASCDCDTSGECLFTGEFLFPEVQPGEGTFFITIEGITTQITFDTEEDEGNLKAEVFAAVIDKNNDNVFIVSFDGDGLVLGVQLVRPCPEQSISLTATVLAPGEFDILPQNPLEIQFQDIGPGNEQQACQSLDQALVVGQTYVVRIDVNLSEGAVTFQMTYGSSLNTGVIPIAAPFSDFLEFAFTVLPGDENAQLCVTVITTGANNTGVFDNVAVAEAVETEFNIDLEADCDCPSRRRKARGFLPFPIINCICIEPGYFPIGNEPNSINNGRYIYYRTGTNEKGWTCYNVASNILVAPGNGRCIQIDKNGRIS